MLPGCHALHPGRLYVEHKSTCRLQVGVPTRDLGPSSCVTIAKVWWDLELALFTHTAWHSRDGTGTKQQQ